MRLLIAGANGQVGREISRAASQHTLLTADSCRLDITDADAVKSTVHAFNPDAVVNAAAYRLVDQAESEPEKAFAVNRDGTANLAAACNEAGIPLIHLSTDCVFDGRKQEAYRPEDPAAPLSVYGVSKLAGEQAVRSLCIRHVILRTSWVFSAHGNNFVKKILGLAGERDELRIVADQRGCPTAAPELARAILHVLQSGTQAWGTYHFCQPEPTTWCAFAEAIVAEAKNRHWPLRVRHVLPIATGDYPTPAQRPANSVMNCSKLETTFGYTIPPWHGSLAEVIDELSARK